MIAQIIAPALAPFTDAESIRHKLTELMPLVKRQVVEVLGGFRLIGYGTTLGQTVWIHYLLTTQTYQFCQKREDGWRSLSGLLANILADAIFRARVE